MKRNADQIKQQIKAQNKADGPQFYIPNDPRLTRVGAILRACQIDEIPQFINVLLGHMSVVGPRPSPYEENQYCPPWREARLSVRPGITGLWQIKRTAPRAPTSRNGSGTTSSTWSGRASGLISTSSGKQSSSSCEESHVHEAQTQAAHHPHCFESARSGRRCVLPRGRAELAEKQRITEGFLTKGLAAFKERNYYQALYNTSQYLSRVRTDAEGRGNPRHADALLAYAESRRLIEEPDLHNLPECTELYKRYLDFNPKDTKAGLSTPSGLQ
jgi:hypothetical protein